MKKSIFLFFAAILCSVSSWAANVGFESSGNTMKYYSNLKSSDQTVNLDRTNGTTTTLGSVTALYLKGFACKMYQDADNTIWGGGAQHAYYKIHRTAVAAGTSGYTDVTNWDWNWQNWNNGWRYPTGSKSLDVNLLSGLGSGKYSMTYYFEQKGSSTWRLPSSTSKYNVLKWTIDAPKVTSASCTSNGTGLGTEESPFMIPVGETLTLTVDGEQSFSDANSVLNVKFGDNAYSSTVTYTLTPTTTKQSITIKVKYYNSADDLSGTEETLTVYFEALEEETHVVTVSYLCNSNPIAGYGDKTETVGVTTPSGIKAPLIDGYTFSSWNLVSGVQSTDVNTANPISITTKSGETDYKLVANYTEDLSTGWYLAGEFNNNADSDTGWNIDKIEFKKRSGESTGTVSYATINLLPTTFSDEYNMMFKVMDGSNWYGNNGEYKKANDKQEWPFEKGLGNCNLDVSLPGTYTFCLNTNKEGKVYLSIAYPIVNMLQIYTATPSHSEAVANWDWDTQDANECSKSLTLNANTTYTFKVISNSEFYGKSTTLTRANASYKLYTTGGDVSVTTDIGGTYVFTWNKETETITVTYPELPTYTVTATADPAEGGIIDGIGTYTHGTDVSLTATAADGYMFVDWSNGSKDNPLKFKASEVVTLTAKFEKVHTVKISYLCGDKSIKEVESKVVGVSTASSIKAPSIYGYNFSGWTLGSGVQSENESANPISITTSSSGDYTLTANYTEDLTTSWVLKGSFVDDFATPYDFVKKSGESTGKVAYTTLELAAHKEYRFKVVDGSTWYGNSNNTEGEKWWIKQTAEDWIFKTDNGDCYMKSGLAGTYTFKIDYSGSDPKVSVYYPEIYAIVGSFNEWDENTNPLAFNGNEGKATINLQASATNYEFKIIDNGVHGGIVSKTITQTESDMAITVGGGDNIKLTANVYPSGDYIFTYDKSTKKLTVTYPVAYTISATADNGTVEGAGMYAENAIVTLTATANTGYEFVNWTKDGVEVSTTATYTFTATEDVALVANFIPEPTYVTPTTVENAYFSVGNNKYVQFSTGNLQYEVGTNTWSFASEQYEVVGNAVYDPANPTNTNYGLNETGYTGKLDLFGWSSDGKFGVNPSNTDTDYEQAFVDWGELVNEAGWYTLTKEEMNYILARTKNGKKLWALATVCDMNGLILLPDNWNTSITLDYGYIPANFNYTKNQIDAAAWQTLEAAGAVFLPEAGTRVGGHGNKEQGGGPAEFDGHNDYFHVDNVGSMGYYWLNTQDTRTGYEECASYLILPGWSDNGTPNDESDDVAHAPQVWSREKRRGNSVRLVKEVIPTYTRDNQSTGAYGTVCYEENIVWCDGATLYEVAGRDGNKVIFDEVATPVAGMPYIFIAEKATINFICGTDKAATAGEHNSLKGTFVQIDPTDDNVLVGNYMLVNNIIKKCGVNCGLLANRAYFVASELESLGVPSASQVPGRRRISLDVQGESQTTDITDVPNPYGKTIKVIRNGQLIIIREGEKYNAQGQRL